MGSRTILIVRGSRVALNEDGSVSFEGGMTIDADGSPFAYAPKGIAALDHLENAGRPGHWWGIATTPLGVPYIQKPTDPAPGYYVSTTSYEDDNYLRNDPRRYLDSGKVPFIVVPGPLRSMLRGVVLGCKAFVLDKKTGKQLEGVVGDFGPATHLGEASMAVADFFGIPSNPRSGGTDDNRFKYTFLPGVPAKGFELQPM